MVLAQPEDMPPMSKKEARFALSPFPPVHISASECMRIEQLVEDELQKALREYEIAGAPPTPREFPKSRYKVVKSHDNCTAYVDRYSRKRKSSKEKTTSSSSVSSSSPTPFDPYHTLASSGVVSGSHSSTEDDPDECTSNWAMPDIVVSGTVPGTLDDVMYGMMTPDSAEMLLRTAYVDDHLLDGGVLQQLQLPTETDPFRSVCVKWYVKGMPSSYKKLVWARDFVFVEATGMVTRQDGARLGYMLRHWLDLEGCGELKGLQRGRFSNCAIYTALSNHTVDIFVRGTVDPGGKMAMSLAIPVAASALLSSSNAVICSYNKKLVWLLDNQKRGDHSVPMERRNMFACGMCAKKFGKLSSVGTCRICCVQMCSRCRLNRSLAYVDMQNHDHAVVEHFSGVFCKNCISQANQMSALDVAQDDIARGRYGSVTQDKINGGVQLPVPLPPLTPLLSHGWSSFGLSLPANAVSRSSAHPTSQNASLYAGAVSLSSQPASTIRTNDSSKRSSAKSPVMSSQGISLDAVSRSVQQRPGSSISNPTTVTDDPSRDSGNSRCSSMYEPEVEEEVSGSDIGEFQEWATASSAAVSTGSLVSDAAPPAALRNYRVESIAPAVAVASQPQPYQSGAYQERQELWRKMTELRLQAESVYRLTKHNSEMHLNGAEGSHDAEAHLNSDIEALD
ncbi:hypothetical protein FI667_g10725, partial [Globisporangium splendens]